MIILAVDPSLHASGWCLLEDERPLYWGVCHIPASTTGDDALRALAGQARRIDDLIEGIGSCDLLAYETQYPGRHAGGDSIALVGRAAGIWIGAVQAVRVMGVAPAVWGAAFKLPRERKDRKAASLRTAKILHPVEWEEDSAEAFLIGLWAYRESRGGKK